MSLVKVVDLAQKIMFFFKLMKMIFNKKNWLWKLKFHEFKLPGAMSIHKVQQLFWSTFILLLNFFGTSRQKLHNSPDTTIPTNGVALKP